MSRAKWIIRSSLYKIGMWPLAEQARLLFNYLNKKPHESDFAALPLLNLKSGIILDIGANIGQSAISFRIFDREHPIVSIEPNPFNTPDLSWIQLWLPKFEFHILGLSSSPGGLTFSVPVIGGVPLTQEGTFDHDILLEPLTSERVAQITGQGQFQIQQQVLKCDTLDHFVREHSFSVAFIKLDVQGHEMEVLRGAAETLKSFRPPLMIETGTGFGEVKKHLESLGYATKLYDPSSGSLNVWQDHHLNAFFLPN